MTDNEESEDITFEAGQVWSYKTRPGDEDSIVAIRSIEETSDGDAIFHVSIQGIRLPEGSSQETVDVNHCPMSLQAFEDSVVELIGDVRWPRSFLEAYKSWKESEGGIFTTNLATISDIVVKLQAEVVRDEG